MNLSRALLSLVLAATPALSLLPSAYAQPSLVPPETFVLRADPRPPEDVFVNGFVTQGTHQSILDHVLGSSCEANTPAERSAWVSLTADESRAIDFMRLQLSAGNTQDNDPSRMPGIWLYSVHTDSSYHFVANIWTRIISLSDNSQQGYAPWQGSVLQQAALNSNLFRDAEVVTQRVAAENIHSARWVTYAAYADNFLDLSREPITNSRFQVPASEMNDEIANLTQLIPSQAIAQYQQPALNRQSCMLACDGASANRTSRFMRSSVTGLNCTAPPSPIQALIGSDD